MFTAICYSTSWKKQPYTRGSYTALAVGASQSDIESLAQPLFRNIHDKKVIFHYKDEFQILLLTCHSLTHTLIAMI